MSVLQWKEAQAKLDVWQHITKWDFKWFICSGCGVMEREEKERKEERIGEKGVAQKLMNHKQKREQLS